MSNFLICAWIYLGKWDYSEKEDYIPPNSWLIEDQNDLGSLEDNPIGIYIFSNYFIWTAITTVGYGSYSGNRTREYVFLCFIEFLSVAFQALSLLSVTQFFSTLDTSFEKQTRNYLQRVDEWLLRIQKTDKDSIMPYELVYSIIKFQEDAANYDFNIVIENFGFY